MQINLDRTISLRRFMPTDRDDLVAGLNNWAVARWLARVPYPYRHDHADEFLGWDMHIEIRSAMGNPKTGGALALCHDDRVIGGLVSNPEDEKGQREIGFWLSQPFWGRGLMRRAATAMIDEILAAAPQTRLVASANHDNLRSQRLIRSLGFVADGQHEVMSTPLQRPVVLHRFRRP